MPINERQHYNMLPTNDYDVHVKRFFSLKVIVAHILKQCVQEYAAFTTEEILSHLDQEHKDTGAYITTLNNEYADVKGRKLNLDIVFKTTVPNTDKLIPIIINLEPQSKFNTGYPLVSRGMLYAARMLSVQEQGSTIEDFYKKIHKVYSIWICYNVRGINENSIFCIKSNKQVICGNPHFVKEQDYDISQVWFINLGDCENAEAGSLLRLLDIAFDKHHNYSNAEKMKFFHDEYNITGQEVTKEVENMNAYVLDYAERYAAEAVKISEARGKEMGIKAIVQNMNKKGLPISVIADYVGVGEDLVRQWLS